MRNQNSIILFLAIATFFLYGFTLQYGFFQDDFYSLAKSQVHNLQDFLNFFVPGQEIYYRPLSMRVFFWLMHTIFGLNPVPYHLVILTLHFFNALLVGKIVTKLSHNQTIGTTAGLLYSTSAIHFISLVWIAEIGLVMGITVFLFSISVYLNHDRGHSKPMLAVSYALGLLVHEYTITLPAILLLIDVYQKKYKNLRRTITNSLKTLWPLAIIAAVYLLARLVIFPLPATGSYSLMFGKPTFWAAFWYGIWSLNIPENLKDQLEPGLKLNQTFLYDFIPLSLTSLITLLLIIIMFAAIPLAVYIQSPIAKRKIISQHLVFCIGWILTTLSIPLITPLHLYPIYASLAFIGIAYAICQLIYFAYKRPRVVTSLVATGWIITSWQSTRFMAKVHWTVQEAGRVKEIYQKISHSFGYIQPNSTIVINQDYQIKQALYGELGLKILLSNPTLKTHYGSIGSILPAGCTIKLDLDTCLEQNQIYLIPGSKP